MLYGVTRATEDLNFIAPALGPDYTRLLAAAGKNPPLYKRHGVYLDPAGAVTDKPVDYELRLRPVAAGQFRHLRLRALAPEDLVLAKLTRASPKDRADLGALAEAGMVDPGVLKRRYEEELRPYLLTTERHDLTAQLWAEEARERWEAGRLRELLAAEDLEIFAGRALIPEIAEGGPEPDTVARATGAERRRDELERRLVGRAGATSTAADSGNRAPPAQPVSLEALEARWLAAHRTWVAFRNGAAPEALVRAYRGEGVGVELLEKLRVARQVVHDALRAELERSRTIHR